MVRKYIKSSFLIFAIVGMLTACRSEDTKPQATNDKASLNEISTDSAENQQLSTENNSLEATTEKNDGEVLSEEATSEKTSEDASNQETSTSKLSETTSKEETTTKKPSGSSSKEETTTKKPATESELSALVKKALAGIIKSNMSELEKVLVIHDYITYNVDYDYDNYLKNTIPSSSYTSYGALTTGRAVCSGYAYLFLEMAKAAGLEVKYVEGTADNGSGNGQQGHVWNQVKVNGAWYNMDTCWDDATWEGKKSDDHSANSYNYCLVSDAVLYKDHKTNAEYVNKCPNGYAPAELAKTLAKVNKYRDMVFVENTAKIEDAIKTMVNAGKNRFSVLIANDGTEHWEQITTAIAKVRQPLWVESYNPTQAVIDNKIDVKENVRIVESASDLKAALDEYKDKLDKLEIWYYDASMTESNVWDIVNGALCKTGYDVEVSGMTMIRSGKVECHIQKVENILRIDELSDAVAYMNSNGIEALKSRYIWYATKDTDESNLGDKLREAFISSGYFVEYDWNVKSEADVIKFKIADMRQVKYISDAQALVSYVNSIGIDNLVGKEFYIKNSEGADACDIVYDMFEQVQYPVDYTLSDWGKIIGVEVNKIYNNVYISVDEVDLKADILDAINKGIIGEVEFRLTDRNGKYSEEDIKKIIDSMNCGVVMDIIWYREGYYHTLTGARII